MGESQRTREIKNILVDAMLHGDRKTIYKTLYSFTDSDHISILTHNEEKGVLRDINLDEEFETKQLTNQSILGLAFHKHEIKLYKHMTSEKIFDPEVDNPYHIKLKSQIIIPILDNKHLLGIIRVSKTISNKRVYSNKTLEDINELYSIFIEIFHSLCNKPIASNINITSKPTIKDDIIHIDALLRGIEEQCSNSEIKGLLAQTLDNVASIAYKYNTILKPSPSNAIVCELPNEIRLSLNLLIVDDTKLNTSILKALLDNKGHNIEIAYDGDEALEKMQRMKSENRSVDILFLDHHMPNMLGSEVAQNIIDTSTLYSNNKLYIVSITNQPEAIMHIRHLYDFHIRKPFLKMELMEVVETIEKSILEL
ncbi:MAG: response regulator [Campylobacterota bacterium]|nr:response regulator [Campylobacterota bacterium]